ncbi:oxidoreductase domain protein [Anaeromyxobacter sp. K]|uniref:Gfo/Idh/MocA family protein n=1 Tax=Anaeromyxobacter sp. (strain K) TaxID=447217 RepID=UPI00015F8E58|nr:Gfo/Idh/MocA family oxidoreductase [Anaeromyxobacter sp. K]ACG75073.1 oxidoreductase domain protein [Anaeromyxobacter sp. K]
MARERRRQRGRRTVGYAVVGLGHIAQAAVLPAFEHARGTSRLAALVSGDATKRKAIGKRHGVPTFGYEDLDDVFAREDVDAVYIALPNTEHAACAVRAARAGVHVLTEKPMATSEDDCRAMIAAAEEGGVKLMVAYRLHFDPATLETVELVRSGKLGEPRFFSSDFSYQVEPGNIRTDARLGGGAIWDLGPYCVNAARYLFGAEPIEVFAMEALARDRRFHGVPEAWSVILRFPDERLATLTCSFGAAPVDACRLVGTKGDVRLEPAFEYVGSLVRHLTLDERTRTKKYPPSDQFAPELVHFSRCVLEDREPEPDGWEGLADVRIIEAALRSARERQPVRLEPIERRRRPRAKQAMHRPPVAKPDVVHAQAPSQ